MKKKTTKRTSRTKRTRSAKAKRTKRPKAAKATAKTPAKKPQAKGNAKPKRTGALDAAATVLRKARKPMRSQELIAAMAEQRLWKSPGGNTPHATLYAAIIREIADKGKAARFAKVERGLFASRG